MFIKAQRIKALEFAKNTAHLIRMNLLVTIALMIIRLSSWSSAETIQCIEEGRFNNEDDRECKSYIYCRPEENSLVKIQVNCPDSTFFDPDAKECTARYSCPAVLNGDLVGEEKKEICTARGKFPDESDPTCQNYYMCSQLIDGSFTKTDYVCPGTSKFNPSKSKCADDYECPIKTVPTTPKPDEGESFVCTKRGKFEDKDNCNSYILCNQYQNGTFYSTKYECPENTAFNPESQKCSATYVCAVTTQKPTTITNGFTCSERGKFEDTKNCSSYYQCNLLQNGTLYETKYDCPAGSLFDPKTQRCSSTYDCPYSLITTTVTTSIPTTIDEVDFDCIENGRFEDGTSCTSYILCSNYNNGSFVATRYICPRKTQFDPSLERCTLRYICPYTTATVWEVTDQSTTVTSITSDGDEDFVCKETGRFEDKTSCSSYYLCSAITNNTYIATRYDCPYNTQFDPYLERCTIRYICPYTTTLLPCTEVGTTNTIEGDNNWECTEKGRFEDKTSCTSYFLCSQYLNGSFVKTKYDCPETSYFDPSIQQCTATYMCPLWTTTTCTPPTTTTMQTTTSSEDVGFICTKRGRFQDETSCTSYYLCSISPNGGFIKTKYECPDDTQFDPSIQRCTAGYICPRLTTTTLPICSENPTTLPDNGDNDWECTKKGRFEDKTSCTSYFLCSQYLNGSFVKTKYDCPETSYFDPSIEQCTATYMCPLWNTTPCIPTTTTPIPTSTTNIPTCTVDPTTTLSDEDNDLVCTEKGRFEDKTSCTSYFLCSQYLNGSFVKTKYDCPSDSYFDPTIEQCTATYMCPLWTTPCVLTSTTPTTPTPTATTLPACSDYPTTLATDDGNNDWECTKKGRFEDKTSCTSYFLCSQYLNGSFVKTKYDCPSGSYFDPPIEQCTTTYMCPLWTTPCILSSTTQQPTTITSTTSDDSKFICTERGRFEDETNCNSYYLCSISSDGSLFATKYDCPEGSNFDPSKKACSSIYVCAASTEATVTESYSTKQSTTTSKGGEEFICTERGKFADENNCSVYYMCSQYPDGSFVKTIYECPDGTNFDPKTLRCSSSYVCSHIITTISTKITETSTTENSITTQQTTISTGQEEFVCTERGRFADKTSCSVYYMCSQYPDGSFVKTEYECPAGSYFDPNSQKCSATYECPHSTETTSTIALELSTSDEPTTEEQTTQMTTTERPTTELSTIQQSSTTEKERFVCMEKGRFADETNCSVYYLCSQYPDGSFVQTEYECPAGSYFDPDGEKCSASYECPYITTISISTTDLSTSEKLNEESTTDEVTTAELSTTQEITSSTDVEQFICTEKGRFSDNTDCSRYYMCSQLADGSYITTEYECPAGTYFDPEGQKCSANYECPYDEATSTLSLELSTKEEASTEKPTTKTTTEFNATQQSTTDSIDNGNFVCIDKGRFADENNCSIYYMCSQYPDGTFIKTEYECPVGVYFDPYNQKCSATYNCPHTTTVLTTAKPTTEISTSPSSNEDGDGEFVCIDKGRFADDRHCSIYYLCSQNPDGSLVKTQYECPDGSYFDPNGQKCTSNYVCPYTTTTTISTLGTEGPTSSIGDEEFICSEKGRFADQTNCNEYYVCSQYADGSFVKTKYQCPVGSSFDPNTQKCSASYVCGYSTASSEIEPSTTSKPSSTSTSTIEPTRNENDEFICVAKGRFAEQTNCSIYYLCSIYPDGSFIKTDYECPDGTNFDPVGQKCSDNYACPLTTTAITEEQATTITTIIDTSTSFVAPELTTTLKSQTTVDTEEIFNCTAEGRFEVKYRCNCYYLCTLDVDTTTFVKTQYDCPNYQQFDPILQTCTTSYICPYTTTSIAPNTEPITPIPSPSSTETINNRIETSSRYPWCTKRGYFSNDDDRTCKSYLFCDVMGDGSLYPYLLICPDKYYFNEHTNLCIEDYICEM